MLKTLKDCKDKEEARVMAIKWIKEYDISPFGSFAEFINLELENLK